MVLQTSTNRRSSLRSSSDRRPGSRPSESSAWKRSIGLLEGVPPDEPHGVERPAVGVGAQAVDRDDPRVLQPAGDLRLGQEPGAAAGFVGVVVEDLLERHLAVQLLVQRHEDSAQAAAGVGAEDAESLAVAGGGAEGVGGGAFGVVVAVAVGAEDAADERRVDLRVADGGEAPPDRRPDPDGGEALLRVAAVLLEVLGGQRLDQPALLDVEMAEGLEVVVQGPGLVAGPGVEGGHELGLVDQADLEGQQAEEEVAVGVGGHRVYLRATVRGRDVLRSAPASRNEPCLTADQSHYRILRSGRSSARSGSPDAQPIVAAPPSPSGPGGPGAEIGNPSHEFRLSRQVAPVPDFPNPHFSPRRLETGRGTDRNRSSQRPEITETEDDDGARRRDSPREHPFPAAAPLPGPIVALMIGPMVACWTSSSIRMTTSPFRWIMPKIGGFSFAKVPRPRSPLSRRRRPSRCFSGPPRDAPYARPRRKPRRIRPRRRGRPEACAQRCLAAVARPSAGRHRDRGPTRGRSARWRGSARGNRGTGPRRAGVDDGQRRWSRSGRRTGGNRAGTESDGGPVGFRRGPAE